MLDSFLKVAYAQDANKKHEVELVELMKQLPAHELYKLASGQEKLSSICSPDGGGLEWIDKFKGTPLFEQAVQIEQESIQLEVANRQQQEMSAEGYRAQDQLGLKRRLLSLQLAQQDQQAAMGGAPAPAPATPPATPPTQPTDPSVPGETPAAPGAEGPPAAPSPKGINIKLGGVDFAAAAGRLMAKHAFAVTEKGHQFDAALHSLLARQAAEQAELHQQYGALAAEGAPATVGGALRFGGSSPERPDALARHHEYAAKQHESGSNAWNPLGGMLTPSSHEEGGSPGILGSYGKSVPKRDGGKKKESGVKHALDPAALLAAGKGMAGKAVGTAGRLAAAHPAAALGAAAGAVGGALAGGTPDAQGQTHRIRGALGGAVGGGIAGYGIQRMAAGGGGGIGQAARNAAAKVQGMGQQPAQMPLPGMG